MTTTNTPTVTVKRCRKRCNRCRDLACENGPYQPNEWDILVDGERVGILDRNASFSGPRVPNYRVLLDPCWQSVYLPKGTTCWAAKAMAKAMALARNR